MQWYAQERNLFLGLGANFPLPFPPSPPLALKVGSSRPVALSFLTSLPFEVGPLKSS